MSTTEFPFETIAGEQITAEQKQYLSGFFAGTAARGLSFGDMMSVGTIYGVPLGGGTSDSEDLIFEEKVKRELHPLDAYPVLLQHATENKSPGKEEIFRFKWNGLFYLDPIKQSYMARLRIPGGVLQSYQLRGLAKIARDLTSGYVQITTRANFQMRLIETPNMPAFLTGVQKLGLHTRGSGADNIRNLTANPTAGIDPVELIDVLPFCEEMGQIILNDRTFYDLPRKFNIAYDGGGLIGSVEDTNDVGCKAVRVGDEIRFRIALGGATGHKAFANDLGVLVRPENLNQVVAAVLRVYIANGNRGDRKKARLKHLLEKWTLGQYLHEVEKVLGFMLERSELKDGELVYPSQKLPHSHVGVYAQKQLGMSYVGVAIPVGHISPEQMERIAGVAEKFGSGEVRLTVWQNLVIPNIPDSTVEAVKEELLAMGLDWRQSNVKSGVIACTGNQYCKFAQSNTKAHALELIENLERVVTLDQPVNVHFTGCPNSCAQHYMGDIGMLGTKVKVDEQSVDGYHIFVGGGFGSNRAVGRQLYNGVEAGESLKLVEKMLLGYVKHRQPEESFQSFTARHDVADLRVLFAG